MNDKKNNPLVEDPSSVVSNLTALCRNTMQAVTWLSTNICAKLDQAELYEEKQLVEKQIQNCYKLLRGAKNVEDMCFYQTEMQSEQVFCVDKILESICKNVQQLLTHTQRKFEFNIEEKDVKINADLRRFENAFLNVLSNAFSYSPAEAKVSVLLSVINNNAVIKVSDNGYGMSSEVLSQAVVAGFTTERENAKQGLGLYLADAFAKRTNGNLIINSKENEGTTVTISLPLTEKESQSLEADEIEYYSKLYSPIDVALSDCLEIKLLKFM